MSDDLHPSPAAAFARGQQLRSMHRLDDAIACFKQALGLDPQHAPSYLMLALCWMEKDDTAAQSVDAAKRAVALEPEDSFSRGVYALALNAIARDGQTAAIKEARQQAEEAVGLDPDSDFAHSVLARLHLRLRDYPAAEKSARHALSLDTENTTAAEVLSAALLLQKKDEDNSHLINYQLQRNAEDDAAHTSAGWLAVSQGDHKKANEHFMEALRLNPMNERARMGLVESYQARSWFYNAYIRFCHWMDQFTEGRQNVILIGGFLAYRILHSFLKTVSPLASHILVGLWLLFALWSHLASGLSLFFVTMDRFARQSLKPREYWEGIGVGGMMFLALADVVLGLAWNLPDSGMTGLACLFAAVTNAAAFTNDHHIGRHVYNVAAGIATLGALLTTTALFTQIDIPFHLLGATVALLIGFIVSWIRPFRVLYA